ncbi:hypothetical protein HK098_002992, partial [Nowakowskiella sp. JEL0407]
MTPLKSLYLLLSLTTLAFSQPPAATTGNCVSGNYTFNSAKTFMVPVGQNASDLNTNPAQYDFTVDYGTQNVRFDPVRKNMQLRLSKGTTAQGDGVRVSTTRYVGYAKMTANIRAAPDRGAVTAFITMSAVKDEIDFETVGKDPTTVQ